MGRRIAIVQSNYIPWKGYFDLIAKVDEFVLYDDAQYTRRDWRNRNRIKTPSGPQWLSIPVASKGKYLEPIKDITVSDPAWNERHWQTLLAHYARAAGFAAYRDLFEEAYRGAQDPRLSVINRRLIEFYSVHYPSDYPEVDAYILMHRLGARTVEVPVRMYARAEGKSSITTFRAVYYMVKVTLSFLINRIRRFG